MIQSIRGRSPYNGEDTLYLTDEAKYGLAVTGFIHPDKILKNAGAKPGDELYSDKTHRNGHYNDRRKGRNG